MLTLNIQLERTIKMFNWCVLNLSQTVWANCLPQCSVFAPPANSGVLLKAKTYAQVPQWRGCCEYIGECGRIAKNSRLQKFAEKKCETVVTR